MRFYVCAKRLMAHPLAGFLGALQKEIKPVIVTVQVYLHKAIFLICVNFLKICLRGIEKVGYNSTIPLRCF